jgi:cytochrome P450
MHTQHITRYAETMARFGERLLERWSDGQQRDIHTDMMQVTIWIIADTMFGMDAAQTPALQAASTRAQAIAVADLTSPLPAWLARGRDRQAAELNAFFTTLVEGFMHERRAHTGPPRHDLLSLLMDSRDEDGQPMPDALVRDNILTLFMAGHETTANTLTWVFSYLDQNPAVAAALHQEVDAVLAGRRPALADLPALPYTLMVIKDAMRLEPTVAIIPRTLTAATELGGYRLQGNSVVFLSPYLLHRDRRWWARPERFDPLRFSAENEPGIPKYAYLPFGGGPRICLGNQFSLMEAQILLALIASRYRLSLAPGARVVPLRQVTTSPLHGLPMRVHRRTR